MHFLDTPLSHHLQVFIKQETYQILLFSNFCTAFTLQHPSPSQRSMGRTKSSNYLIFLVTIPILRFCWELGEDPLEKEMATHSSTLAWKIPWEKPGRLQSMGSQRVRHN